jgi:dsRNA-specific ribonuclease
VPELGVRSTGIGASRRIAEQQAALRAIAGITK